MTDEDDDPFDDEEEGELVGKGSFTIDPSVAAEKLGAFQLGDAGDFLLPWMRAAVAYGASRVEARDAAGGLSFSFDGRPLEPAVLADLTAGLLVEDYGEGARQLAYGALAAGRFRPHEVAAARGVGGTTVLRVRWAEKAAKALDRLKDAYGMTPVELVVQGERVADPSLSAPPVRAFGGTRTRCVILESRRMSAAGRVHFYKLGARVETVPLGLGGAFEAFVSNDRFELSLSQDRVVKDKRWDKVVGRLARLRRRLARWEPPPPSGWRERLRRLFF